MSATLKELAGELGLSVSTVSRVLNGKGVFSEETRRRILEAAEKFDYAPNAFARSLREQSYHAIGLMVPNVTNPYYSSILEKVEEECQRAGYTLLIGVSNFNVGREKHFVDYLMSNQVNGMILASHDSDEEVMRILARGLQVVSLNEHKQEVCFNWVAIDNRKAMFDLTQYMINQHHRNIACMHGDRNNIDNITAEMRKCGYMECMAQNHLEIRPEMVIPAGLTYATGREAARQLICQRQMPTAIVCHNNEIAAGAYDALKEAGFDIPGDVSIACFDSIVPRQIIGKQFTAIVQPLDKICHQAIRILIEGNDAGETATKVRFPYVFIKGETTRRCKN